MSEFLGNIKGEDGEDGQGWTFQQAILLSKLETYEKTMFVKHEFERLMRAMKAKIIGDNVEIIIYGDFQYYIDLDDSHVSYGEGDTMRREKVVKETITNTAGLDMFKFTFTFPKKTISSNDSITFSVTVEDTNSGLNYVHSFPNIII